MSSATVLGGVVGEAAAGAAELVVESDGCGECGEAGAEARAEIAQCAGAVTLKRQDVLAGREDRLDPLTDWLEVRSVAGLVLASWPHDHGVERGQLSLEVFAAEV